MEELKNKVAREEYGVEYSMLSPSQKIAITDKIAIQYLMQWSKLQPELIKMVTDNTMMGEVKTVEYSKESKQVTIYACNGVFRIAILQLAEWGEDL